MRAPIVPVANAVVHFLQTGWTARGAAEITTTGLEPVEDFDDDGWTDSDERAIERLHHRLAGLGDSLVVVGVDTPTGREWNVHVHVADVGAAIEAGIEAGRPHRISVTPLAPVRPPAAALVSG